MFCFLFKRFSYISKSLLQWTWTHYKMNKNSSFIFFRLEWLFSQTTIFQYYFSFAKVCLPNNRGFCIVIKHIRVKQTNLKYDLHMARLYYRESQTRAHYQYEWMRILGNIFVTTTVILTLKTPSTLICFDNRPWYKSGLIKYDKYILWWILTK
jgi:hypothetical protein